jgi:hypothetical protein
MEVLPLSKIRWSHRSDGQSQPRDGRIRAEVQFIRLDPVCCDRLLCRLEVKFSTRDIRNQLAWR